MENNKDQANLGLASTHELLTELHVRFTIDGYYESATKIDIIMDDLPAKALTYKTVDKL